MQVPEEEVLKHLGAPHTFEERPHPSKYAGLEDGSAVPSENVLEPASRQQPQDGNRRVTDKHGYARARSDPKKRYGLSDPDVWAAIQRTLAQQNRLSSIAPHEASPVKAGSTRRQVPSRTSSQRRALTHFARELEKYAHVTDAAGKLPVITPTESDEKFSLHTVEALFPYKKEFEAAGLAITADQQRNGLPEQTHDQIPRGESCASNHGVGQSPYQRLLDGGYDSSSDSATPSSEWVVEFPHPDPVPKAVTFPAGQQTRPAAGKESPSRGRMLLPWLRKKHNTMEPEATPRTRVGTMVETRKGEWKLAGKETQPKAVSSAAVKDQTLAKETRDTQPSKPIDPAPQTPTNPRPYVVRSHIAEFVNGSSNAPNRTRRIDEDRKAQFRQKRELAQASLPRVRSNKHDQDLDSRPHHHPFFQNHHHSPHHRIHHVHGAPVTWVDTKPDKSPKQQSKDPQMKRKPVPKSKLPSPAPELPYTWKYAVSNASSLERALNVAQERVERMSSQALRPNNSKPLPRIPLRPAKELDQSHPKSHKHHPLLAKDSCRDYAHPKPPPKPVEAVVTTEQVKTGTAFDHDMLLDRRNPLSRIENRIESRQITDNVAIPRQFQEAGHDSGNGKKPYVYSTQYASGKPDNQPVMAKENTRRPSQGNGDQTQPASPNKPPDDLEAVLSYLDVFFDTDDATIDDRDVLQGLQVAVKAAADDLYDALLRERTGLRIRRFLADLKAIDAFDAELAVNSPARPKQTERRRSKKAQKPQRT